VLRELKDRRPAIVMLENVRGFLTSHDGEDFKAAARTLADLGYWIDAFLLDAAYFTPQSRPRVFVIGMAADVRSEPGPTPFPSRLRPAALIAALAKMKLPTGWAPLDLPELPQRRLTLEDVIDTDDGQAWWTKEEVKRHYEMMSERHRSQVVAAMDSGETLVATVFRRIRRGAQRAEVRFDGLAGCLRTPKGGSGRQIVLAVKDGGLRMRWMSPREYARLQGTPDFPLTLPTNQMLFGFADAVCVPAISWIDDHVLTPLCRKAALAGGSRTLGKVAHPQPV
jgi:DNA (cytosine-5)-methyltransferase 1